MRKDRVKRRGCVGHEERKNKGERKTPELNFHMKGEVSWIERGKRKKKEERKRIKGKIIIEVLLKKVLSQVY